MVVIIPRVCLLRWFARAKNSLALLLLLGSLVKVVDNLSGLEAASSKEVSREEATSYYSDGGVEGKEIKWKNGVKSHFYRCRGDGRLRDSRLVSRSASAI